jgi:hypothetical protein
MLLASTPRCVFLLKFACGRDTHIETSQYFNLDIILQEGLMPRVIEGTRKEFFDKTIMKEFGGRVFFFSFLFLDLISFRLVYA